MMVSTRSGRVTQNNTQNDSTISTKNDPDLQEQAGELLQQIVGEVAAMEESKQAEPMVQEAVAEGAADNTTVTVAASEADGGATQPAGDAPNPKVYVREKLKMPKLKVILPTAVRDFLKKYDAELASNNVTDPWNCPAAEWSECVELPILTYLRKARGKNVEETWQVVRAELEKRASRVSTAAPSNVSFSE